MIDLKWLVRYCWWQPVWYGNSYYADESLLYRVLALLVLAVLQALVALHHRSQRCCILGIDFKEARTEIRKVVWPTRQETTQTTLIVVVFVVAVSAA